MILYCCACKKAITGNLISGEKVYPHRKDLYSLPFWECPTCLNFVGCHHRNKDNLTPYGSIPFPQLSKARSTIHKVLDPLWKSSKDRRGTRKKLYKLLDEYLGKEYHTATINTLEEAEKVYMFILNELSEFRE